MKIITRIRDEITYFFEKNEEILWCITFIIWLGWIINAQ